MASPVAVAPAEPTDMAPPPMAAEDLAASPAVDEAANDPHVTGLQHVPLTQIVVNQQQPREHFDPLALQRLADSIRVDGVMQPIVLRKHPQAGYELVAGERRWRAAGMADLTTVPALIHDLDDQQTAEWALIENLHREDLNPIERATAFQSLSNQHGMTQAELAERMGLDRSTVTNLLRLLKLAPTVQDLVSRGTLSMSQARSIASIDDHQVQLQLAKTAVQKSWSVRETEEAVRQANAAATDGPPLPTKTAAPRAAYLADLERQIADQLSTKVKLRSGRKKGSGTLAIDFYSIDEFDQLMTRLGVQTS